MTDDDILSVLAYRTREGLIRTTITTATIRLILIVVVVVVVVGLDWIIA
jgi:hypothetical protein